MAMGAVSLGLGMYGFPAKYSTAVGRTKKLRPFHFKRSVPVSCAHAPSLRTLVGEVAFNSSLIGRNGANLKYTWLRPSYTTRVAKESSGLVGDDEVVADGMVQTLNHIKASLYQAIDGINRGIFGVPSGRKSKIEDLVKQLESQNPTPNPTANLEKMGGCWKLLYSTITILGSKRTKLGLRDFISLGDFLQTINVAEGKAVNVIKFNAKGLSMLNGQLIIDASFRVSSESRVDISYSKSTITPDQMMNVFRQNYELLLGIFNPEGWLEITYVDDTIRIGRDNKGNIFILERSETP